MITRSKMSFALAVICANSYMLGPLSVRAAVLEGHTLTVYYDYIATFSSQEVIVGPQDIVVGPGVELTGFGEYDGFGGPLPALVDIDFSDR